MLLFRRSGGGFGLLDNGADVNLLYKEFTLPANLFNHGFLHGLGGYNTNTFPRSDDAFTFRYARR